MKDIKFSLIESSKLAFELLKKSCDIKSPTIIEKAGTIKFFEIIFDLCSDYLKDYLEEHKWYEMKHDLNSKKSLKDYKFSEFMLTHLYDKIKNEYFQIMEEFFDYLDKKIEEFGISVEDLSILKMFLLEIDVNEIMFYYYPYSKNKIKTLNLVVDLNPDDVLYYINKANYFKYFFSVIDKKEFKNVEKLSNKKLVKLYLLDKI